MAGVASQPAGMLGSYDLREPLRLGAVFLMTARANDRRIEFRRLNARIFGMIRECAMARLAGNHDVLPSLLFVGDVGVAGFASLVAGVNDRLGRYLSDGGATKMPVLTKTLGNDGCAQNYKRRKCDQHDRGQPDQVFYVLEQARLPGNAIRITLLDSCTSQGLRSTMIEVTEDCDGGHER